MEELRFKNSGCGVVKMLAFFEDVALLERENKKALTPYILAHGFSVDGDAITWSQGGYFTTLENAKKEFKKELKK